jgi:rare lipoprotein A
MFIVCALPNVSWSALQKRHKIQPQMQPVKTEKVVSRQKSSPPRNTVRTKKTIDVELVRMDYERSKISSANTPQGRNNPLTHKKAVASWYGPGFHGRIAANGKRYNCYGVSVAHKTLPLGSIVQLTNPRNGKSILAPVTDRGPYIKGRDFDLSVGAWKKLGEDLDDGLIVIAYKTFRKF